LFFCLHADIFTDGKAVIEATICPIKVVYLLNKNFTDVQCEILKSMVTFTVIISQVRSSQDSSRVFRPPANSHCHFQTTGTHLYNSGDTEF